MRMLDMCEHAWVACAPVRKTESDEFETAELASIGNAVAKRQREFLCGRRLARELLASKGYPATAIPAGSDRLPEWPRGVVASISHTDSLVAVALARSPGVISLGLDIEQIDAAPDDIRERVLLQSEKQASNRSRACLTDYFSAKEAVFKASFPLHREYFEFTDIEVEFSGDGFQAQPVSEIAAAATVRNGRGITLADNGHVVSLFVVT